MILFDDWFRLPTRGWRKEAFDDSWRPIRHLDLRSRFLRSDFQGFRSPEKQECRDERGNRSDIVTENPSSRLRGRSPHLARFSVSTKIFAQYRLDPGCAIADDRKQRGCRNNRGPLAWR